MTTYGNRDRVPAVVLTAAVVCSVAFGVLTSAPAATAKAAPAGKTYFAVTVGLFAAHDLHAGCLTFTGTRMCFLGGPCGEWAITRRTGGQAEFDFHMEYDPGGGTVRVDGVGRIDDRGPGSSLTLAGLLSEDATELNFSLAGRATRTRKCASLYLGLEPALRIFDSNQCLGRARFGDPATSHYALPFPVGSSYGASQAYCDPRGSHHSKFAYDFDLPIGATIVAARGGVVWKGTDRHPDSKSGDEFTNVVFILHDDGSVAYYAHLRQGSLRVSPGDRVEAGESIAASGSSGTSSPHLHFQVHRGKSLAEDSTIPVSFRNAEGPLDENGGLVAGAMYTALPW